MKGENMQQNGQAKTISSQRQSCPFSFRCPKHWEVKDLSRRDEAKFQLRGPLDSSQALFAAVIVRAWASEECAPAQMAHEWIGRRSAFRTFHLLARTETKLAGAEAVQVDAVRDVPLPLYAINAKMVPVQEQVIFATCEGVAYELTYRFIQAHFQEHLAVFEDVVTSFQM